MSSWRERAEYVSSGNWRILGENDFGELLVPIAKEVWRDPFNPWNPLHWEFYLRSRITGRIAFL